MVVKEKCRVTWCNNLRKKRSQVCEKHSQYKNICRAAIRLDRPHLMYKVEKWLEGKHQCERCGFDPTISYPNLDLLGQSSMLDVDHIDSNLKYIEEDPTNYQLLCKHCHIVKSREEGDCISKINRK
ncbi:MAG: hypothetical protein CMD20_01215 [Flavobacteriales bacterium]|jgi:hypothetical protein|nr:hypothetical protein [Flavobacteriales bacterium]|tara:strand:+ start:2339 stop:2716 length:378 start_codon:yes stop_codon:yes gene_type:complete